MKIMFVTALLGAAVSAELTFDDMSDDENQGMFA